MSEQPKFRRYRAPAGGWGSVSSVFNSLRRERVPVSGSIVLARQNETHKILQLITLRSNDQFNTTIYGCNDRFRGIHGTRMVVLLNREDMARLGVEEGDSVRLVT